MSESAVQRQLKALGMCKRAGKLVSGTELVCEAVKKGRAVVVVTASGASPSSIKRVADKCAFYGVEHILVDTDTLSLGAAIGKSTAASAAITDRELSKLFKGIEDKKPEGL